MLVVLPDSDYQHACEVGRKRAAVNRNVPDARHYDTKRQHDDNLTGHQASAFVECAVAIAIDRKWYAHAWTRAEHRELRDLPDVASNIKVRRVVPGHENFVVRKDQTDKIIWAGTYPVPGQDDHTVDLWGWTEGATAWEKGHQPHWEADTSNTRLVHRSVLHGLATEPTPPRPTTTNDLLQVLTARARGSERSIQIEAGPSELGNDCRRRVAHLLTGSPRPNISRDEWTAAVGTACHAWVQGAFEADNSRRMAEGRPPRWLIEVPVEIRTGLIGHCDLFDLETFEVIDHKFPGVTSIRKYRAQGHPGQQYRWQAHLYGLGWERLGLTPRNVSLVMYPRSGMLRDTWKWTEPYDRSVAEEALAAADEILVDANLAELSGVLDAYFLSLPRDTAHCAWCPYLDRTSTEASTGCKGPFHDPAYEADPPRHEMLIPGIL